MLRKSGLALLLFLCLAFAANAQDDSNRLLNRLDGFLNTAEERLGSPGADTRRENRPSLAPSFSIRNHTGFDAVSIFIRREGETQWGENILTQPLANGQRINVNLDESFDGLYSIRMIDIDGDFYSKHDIRIQGRSVIRMEIGDFEW